MKVTIDEAKRTMTIVMPIKDPEPSKTGKTMVFATTSGGKASDAKLNGKPVTINLTAWIKPG